MRHHPKKRNGCFFSAEIWQRPREESLKITCTLGERPPGVKGMPLEQGMIDDMKTRAEKKKENVISVQCQDRLLPDALSRVL